MDVCGWREVEDEEEACFTCFVRDGVLRGRREVGWKSLMQVATQGKSVNNVYCLLVITCLSIGLAVLMRKCLLDC